MIVRWIRRIVGSALLAWSAWTLIRPYLEELLGDDVVDVDGIRIRPLTPAETRAAIVLERELGS